MKSEGQIYPFWRHTQAIVPYGGLSEYLFTILTWTLTAYCNCVLSSSVINHRTCKTEGGGILTVRKLSAD